MSGAEQTRKSWRYPGDKLNRNLLGRTSGLSGQVLRSVVYGVGAALVGVRSAHEFPYHRSEAHCTCPLRFVDQ